MKRVRYIFPTSHHYRLPFHLRLRDRLAERDVDYRVVYSDPREENRLKGDTVDVPSGIKVPTRALAGTGLLFQQAMGEAARADLVIIQQENRLLLNYALNLGSIVGLKRVAYFGHGRNFQARDPDSIAERWKSFWATKVDWWFAYTEETRRHVAGLGFPADRITVFNNSVDTGEVRRLAAQITSERMAERRRELDLAGRNVAVFVGGIYADKRIGFIVDAACRLREKLEDFELIMIGGGAEFERLKALAAPYRWIKIMGPRFGADKAELMSLGEVFFMPGLVGLAILDAAVMGLPTMTTAFPWHSPEIAYLEDGVNGLIVREWEDPSAYAEAVAALLADKPRLQRMRAAAVTMSEQYTIEAMAERFGEGVVRALA